MATRHDVRARNVRAYMHTRHADECCNAYEPSARVLTCHAGSFACIHVSSFDIFVWGAGGWEGRGCRGSGFQIQGIGFDSGSI